VESKTISPEEARTHRLRHVLWKYIGSKEVGDGPEVVLVELRRTDRIVLCTSALHEAVDDSKILACVLRKKPVQNCAEELCQLAQAAGGEVNGSCIVLELGNP
jgi:protein phosphatase